MARHTSQRGRASTAPSCCCSCVSAFLIVGVVSKHSCGGAAAFLHPQVAVARRQIGRTRTLLLPDTTTVPNSRNSNDTQQRRHCHLQRQHCSTAASSSASAAEFSSLSSPWSPVLPTRVSLSAAPGRCRWRSSKGVALRATVAPWAAVEGGSGAAGDGDEAIKGGGVDAQASGGEVAFRMPPAAVGGVGGSGGVVLIEQDGPAWTEIVWDEEKERFVGANSLVSQSKKEKVRGAVGGLRLLIQHWFIPEDVTPDYYHFTAWRMFQRFVAGTINVFGTQALLLALGIKSRRLGAAAAMSWVLKDALGKFGRILWASRMGRRFDSDAKRWRFRSSLLYAAGNGLEIVTYVFPASFLLLAAAANSLKQMSMLTSSATRNTIYRSFARGENIGDITAKGEAQIAMVDLFGMLAGVGLCTLVGTSRHSIVAAYVLLSVVDIVAIYREIRSVVFTVLNHERTHILAGDYVAASSDPRTMIESSSTSTVSASSSAVSAAVAAVTVASTAASSPDAAGAGGAEKPVREVTMEREGGGMLPAAATMAMAVGGGGNEAQSRVESSPWQQPRAPMPIGQGKKEEEGKEDGWEERVGTVRGGGERGDGTAAAAVVQVGKGVESVDRVATAAAAGRLGTALLSSPATVSRRENIFLSSKLKTNVFKTWSQAGVSMDGVDDLLSIFGGERYMLAFTPGGGGGRVAASNRTNSSGSKSNKTKYTSTTKKKTNKKGTASIILHRDATGADTVKSLLALEYFRDELAKAGVPVVGARSHSNRKRPHKRQQGRAVVTAGAGVGASVPVNGDGVASTVINGNVPIAAVNGDTSIAVGIPQNAAAAAGKRTQGAREAARDPSTALLLRCLEVAKRRADEGAPGFFEALAALGWSTEKFMFGNIESRVEWRL